MNQLRPVWRSSFTTILAVPLILTSCGTNSARTPEIEPDVKIHAAWVVLGENGGAIARVVTTAAACPDLVQDGAPQRMSVRAQPADIAQRRTASGAADSKPSQFPVLTCEAALNKGIQSASVGRRQLPLPRAEPQRIVVIADTGCRMKKADNAFQACNDESAWPFKKISETAAAFKPDLVIHVGDLHYRENACPDGNAGCAGNVWGYGWDTWNADLFKPAASLFGAAPWVMVRGNHESCARAGQGWWRFLDPRPLRKGRDCNLEADDLTGDYSDPYAVPIGADAQLIVFDSSKIPGKPLTPQDAAYQTYIEQFKTVNRLSENAGFNIFMNHHPILGFAPEKKSDSQVEAKPGNAALQEIMQTINAKRLFPRNVQAALSGHVHLFEAIGFESDHPTQFISGNGGSSNDVALPVALTARTTPFQEAVVSSFFSTRIYGFMTIERIEKKWMMKSWDRSGGLMASCEMEGKKTVCKN